MKAVLILLLSIVSLISAQDIVSCDNGTGECMNADKCKTDSADDVIERFSINMCSESEVCCALNPVCGTRDFRLLFSMRSNIAVASFGEVPWQVALLTKQNVGNDKYIGGGSLIHRSFVLTSATKVMTINATDLIARVGESDFTATTEDFQHVDCNVKNIIIHEGFQFTKARPNNIALLHLEKPVKLGQHINIICLPPPNVNYDNKMCEATSWGKNKFDDATTEFPTIVKRTEMKILPKAECEVKYEIMNPPMNDLPPGIICAGGGDTDTCLGHGGSPLVRSDEYNSYYQVGIVAWGLGCKKPDVPIAYTEVSFYVNWINEKINKLSST
ncbi:unnamed protein product [Diamesa serratosioi]